MDDAAVRAVGATSGAAARLCGHAALLPAADESCGVDAAAAADV